MSDPRRALEEVLPAEALIGDDGMEAWSVGGALPEAVVAPSSVEEVGEVLRTAGRARFGVVPTGRLTAPGPEAPEGPFVILCTRRLSGVEDYEPSDLTVTARAGTGMDAFEAALAEHGQWLPADPPHLPRRSLGGLVATGAAGPLATAYGAPRDHVLGLTVVTGDGRVLRLGGRVMKNVAGFDLVKLMVGSRGTLGVVVSASLRLFPRPAADQVWVVAGAGPGALLGTARRVATAAVVPASATLVAGAPLAPGSAALVVRVQGAPAAVAADADTLLGDGLGDARHADGAEAARLLAGARDHAAGHPVVLRAFALPSHLAEVVSAVHDSIPVDALAADILSGRVRVGVTEADAVQPEAVAKLRQRLEALGGTVVVERCPPGLLPRVPAYGDPGRVGALAASLRGRFDPGGVLSPGRFAP